MIECIKQQQERQAAIDDAERNYVDLIGKVEPFGTKGIVGVLYKCKVETGVKWRAYVGDTTYRDNKAFDIALAKVIRKNFTQLSEEALLLMQAEADEAHMKLREELEEALADIVTLEEAYHDSITTD